MRFSETGHNKSAEFGFISVINSVLYTNMQKVKRTQWYKFEDKIYKFGGNIKEYEYCYKFEIKYCGKIVLRSYRPI
jgi:hypothetical protein